MVMRQGITPYTLHPTPYNPHHDQVKVGNGVESVCDGDEGRRGELLANDLLQLSVRVGVDVGGRFVHDHNRTRPEQNPCDGQKGAVIFVLVLI